MHYFGVPGHLACRILFGAIDYLRITAKVALLIQKRQFLYVKVERCKQPKFLRYDLREG